MVKVILSGCCGKMGKMVINCSKDIEDVCIVAGIDVNNNPNLEFPIFNNMEECTVDAHVILDFSRPAALKDLSKYALDKNIPIVLCTTGYTKEETFYIENLSKTIPIFHSANMSIGVNVVNNLLKKISPMLYKNFDIEIIEKHHNQKVDAPSGTALLLANTIKDSITSEETDFTYGRKGSCKREHKEIGIHAIRGGSIVGDHEVIFAGQGECIQITHTALSREVFAVGALNACKYICAKANGLYNMDDLINESMH